MPEQSDEGMAGYQYKPYISLFEMLPLVVASIAIGFFVVVVSGEASVRAPSVQTAQSPIHNEVTYIGDLFAKEQAELYKNEEVSSHVDTF